jgi:cysteine synthase B
MAFVLPIPHLARTEAEPLLATIGNTPLLRLEKIPREFPGVEIFAKAEYFNPGGSVKDRAALNMVLDGERSGKLNHSRVILDATSGNTGIAYAMIGANRGYKVKLCCPPTPPEERQRILKAYGAEMVFSDAAEGPTAPFASAARSTWPIPTATSTPISTTIRPTGRRTSSTPARRSSADRRAPHSFRGGHGHQRHLHRHHRRLKRDVPEVQMLSRRSLPAGFMAWKA